MSVKPGGTLNGERLLAQRIRCSDGAYGMLFRHGGRFLHDEHFMRLALEEATLAIEHDDVPIGAVATLNDEVIASARNERELRQDPTAHAEILVLREAAKRLETWKLNDVDVFVTLEPCPMCAGALVAARVRRVIYGAADLKAGAAQSLYNIVQDQRLNHRVELTTGVLADESARLLREFFGKKRSNRESL
ncbi:MAG TPA: tRNA adenosine(34) deaminase TadA [Actinomycetota bacterium]|nr:tRNA adenosine(34) deaminase TadA [Actinomycetota bacterium]